MCNTTGSPRKNALPAHAPSGVDEIDRGWCEIIETAKTAPPSPGEVAAVSEPINGESDRHGTWIAEEYVVSIAKRPAIEQLRFLVKQPPTNVRTVGGSKRRSTGVIVGAAAAALATLIVFGGLLLGQEDRVTVARRKLLLERTATPTDASQRPATDRQAGATQTGRTSDRGNPSQPARAPSDETEQTSTSPVGAPGQIGAAQRLLERARRAREQGQLQAAYELAQSSQTTVRSSAAVELMVSIACQRGHVKRARRLMAMLRPKRQRVASRRCRRMEVPLSPVEDDPTASSEPRIAPIASGADATSGQGPLEVTPSSKGVASPAADATRHIPSPRHPGRA